MALRRQLAVVGGTLTFFGIASYYRIFLAHKVRASYPKPASLVIQPETDVTIAREANGDLRLRWQSGVNPVKVYAGTRPDAIDHARLIAQVESGSEALVTGLNVTQRYYFELQFSDGSRLKAAERVLPLPSAVNLRDIGGYRTRSGQHTRWGTLFRSGSLAKLNEADVAYLSTLGINVVCDLRTPHEAGRTPDRLPSGAAYWLRPVFDDGESSAGLRRMLFNLGHMTEVVKNSYTEQMLDQKAHVFAEILQRTAKEAPILVHCTAGKDRTGVAMSLLLAVLGVPDETIVADYSLTNLYYEAITAQLADTFERLKLFRITPTDLAPILTANPVLIRAVLEKLQTKYGGIEAYLTKQAGLSPTVIEDLRARLLEA